VRALRAFPGFSEYHFIDIDLKRAAALSQLAVGRSDVHVYSEDGNKVIREEILPRLSYESHRRGVVLLDPYGLVLELDVVHSLGQSRTTDVIINFPTMDVNRNALRRKASDFSDIGTQRMTRWWGDESWREDFYKLSPQMGL
jgi:three-Cys-motif partner protein